MPWLEVSEAFGSSPTRSRLDTDQGATAVSLQEDPIHFQARLPKRAVNPLPSWRIASINGPGPLGHEAGGAGGGRLQAGPGRMRVSTPAVVRHGGAARLASDLLGAGVTEGTFSPIRS